MRYQLLLAVCATAALSVSTPAVSASPWQEKTKSTALKWELGYLALGAIDTVQTVSCLERGICAEGNPLLGKHPSTKKLIAVRVVGSLIHFGIFTYVNERNPKAAMRFAQISAGIQGTAVLLNARFTFK